jgi:ribosomal protein L9
LDDKPIMGLKSEKNYITSNAVDVILMPTKKRPNKEILYKEKRNYGKVPEYLSKIREDIEKEYKTIREMQIRNEEDELKKKKKLNNEEIESLREGLQKKLEQLKKEYGNITHKTVFDTLVTQKKKIRLEKEIKIVENDLEKISKGQIIIDMTR